MLTFYHSGGMSCAVATHIALEEAGADYKDVKVDFSASEQRSPAFLKINPKGRVPVLVTDRGILTETVALLLYVAQTHPPPSWRQPIPSSLRSCRPSTPTSPPPCMWPMPTSCAAHAGAMTRRQSNR